MAGDAQRWFACNKNPFTDEPTQIRKLDFPSLDGAKGFDARFRNRLPVVIVDVVSTWPAMERWQDTDYMKKRLCQFQQYCVDDRQQNDCIWTSQPEQLNAPLPETVVGTVPVMIARDGMNFLELDEYVQKKDLDVSLLVDSAFPGELAAAPEQKLYARIEVPRPLIDDVRLPFEFFAENIAERKDRDFFSPWNSRIWVGTKGNITPTHFDRAHGVLCQIRGTKRVIMFAPEDTANIYPFASHRSDAHAARVNIHAIFLGTAAEQEEQIAAYPKAVRAQPYVCDLQPGEILYVCLLHLFRLALIFFFFLTHPSSATSP